MIKFDNFVGQTKREEVIERAAEFAESYETVKLTLEGLSKEGIYNRGYRKLRKPYEVNLIEYLPPTKVFGMFYQIIKIK